MLRLEELQIVNFKSFRGDDPVVVKLDQAPGLYFITGRNKVAPELGANGVGKSTIWDALLWTLWGKTERDSRPSTSILPWGGDASCLVSLTFTRDNKTWLLTRERKPNQITLADLTPLVDGRAAQPRVIEQREIPVLLGMTEELFRRTVVLGQFSSMFLDLKPEEQSSMFTEALGLDKWIDAAERAADSAKRLAKQEVTVVSDLAAHTARIAEINDQLDASTQADKEFSATRAARIKDVKQSLAFAKCVLDTHVSARHELVLFTSDPRDSKDDYTRTNTARTDTLRGEAGPRAKRLNEHRAALKQFEASLAKYNESDLCPECGQRVDEAHIADKIAELKKKVKATSRAIEDLAPHVLADEKEMHALLLDRAEQCAIWDATIKTYKESLEATKAWADKLSKLDMDVATTAARLEDVKAQDNPHTKALDRLEERLVEVEMDRVVLEHTAVETRGALSQARAWADAFKEIRLQQIDSALEELELAALRHAGALGLDGWGIRFATERETTSGGLALGFTTKLFPPGESEPVRWESYSGGEAQRWQLAVAFGLSEILLARAGVTPNVEVYDEPTRGLSPAGVESLLEALRERARELGRAIFFVDHHSLDRGSFDGCFMVTKSASGSSIKQVY